MVRGWHCKLPHESDTNCFVVLLHAQWLTWAKLNLNMRFGRSCVCPAQLYIDKKLHLAKV